MNDQAAEVEEAYRQYVRDYSQQVLVKGASLEIDAVDFWSFPILSVGESISLMGRDDFVQSFRTLYDHYESVGWAGRVDVPAVDVLVLCDGLAILEGRGERYRGDGTIIDSWDLAYLMRKAGGRWQIIAVSSASRPRPDGDLWRSWLRSAFGIGG